MSQLRFLAFCALALALGACETTINGRPAPTRGDGQYESVSPFVVEQIEETLRDVPYMRGQQVLDACAQVARVGPGAIPKLDEAAADDDPMRRVFVMNVLGAIGDRRALEVLRRGTADANPHVRCEAARSCVRLGDWESGFPVLIDGLNQPSVYIRTLCNDALRKTTNLDFAFDPKGSDGDRAAAVARWKKWWGNHHEASLTSRN